MYIVNTTMAMMAVAATESTTPSALRSWFNLSDIVSSRNVDERAGHYTNKGSNPKQLAHLSKIPLTLHWMSLSL
jgi:hypothetical protein